jgi:signal transduction histidine kinase
MSQELSSLQNLRLHLSSRRETIISLWRERVLIDQKVTAANHLSRFEFRDHIPVVLHILEERLEENEVRENNKEMVGESECEAAQIHGDERWHQGYSMEEIIREWNHLNMVVLQEIENFCSHLEPEEQSTGITARRIWASLLGEGLSQSAARFDVLQQAQAQINVHDLEGRIEQIRLFEQERGVILRQATHDIRGSLSVVRGATSLLDWHQIEKLPPEDRQSVFRILTNGVNSLWEMMSDMLDLARLEARVETINLGHFDVGVVLGELCDSASAMASEKKLDFIVDGPSGFWVEGDAIKTKRIAQNLLLNSLKYTKTGYVRFFWNDLPENRWKIEIHDSGPGLNEDEAIKQLTSDKATGQNAQYCTHGEGVGLSIVRRLCELCNATFQIESCQQGSNFSVIFPKSYS